ncbi:hypothetical protein E3O55_18940 [Cryobacterium sp. MDB1-18-2]|uniref:hypothetical protein n=1 Tax=unclassified Cryobacterium TaxID=2649013 RepID=UPI00106D04F9|nr:MULTISPECIES: hypothetical protein [unclassified Cryobacterium]TFC22095.1 hypothetical protein E3O55_18940 [Cryobacterium sp. MDB1-18-2]TFC40668.1 hypothetical protein E3O50_12735 [Cryobacterium sp. MDB1-18-1]
MNELTATVSAEPAFDLAAQLIAEAAARDFHPTAAEFKLQMLNRMPMFSEKQLGFRKFIDFLREAQAQGRLFVFLDNNGHPRVSGEPVLAEPVLPSQIAPEEQPPRMRQDLWSSIVHWEDMSDRFWDRKERRAIYVPVNEAGSPLWNSEPDRFARIIPVSRDKHVEWMNEFAERLGGEKRDALLHAVGPDAKRGAFKFALRRYDLTAQWGAELQSRVTEHAEAWAKSEDVRLDHIVERTSPQSAPASPPSDTKIAPPPRPSFSLDSVQSHVEPVTETDLLRRRVHGVIDRMNLAELAALQVPAIYLLSE